MRKSRFTGLLFLVVDDDELSRQLLALLLAEEGHEVEIAASGEQALARLDGSGTARPDVILSDMQMPGICGAELAEALRSAHGPDTKLLAMSGSRPLEAALKGFDGFLLKPFAMEALDAELAQAVTRIDLAAASDRSHRGTDSDVPALDEDIFGKMAKMMPGAALGEMYTMCLTDARHRLEQMRKLAKAGDDEGFRRTAHTVKGGCGMIGATELYALAETAERDGLVFNDRQTNGTNEITTLLERFSYACDRLERILDERTKQKNPRPHPETKCR